MKRLDASPDSSTDVRASVCSPLREGKLPKRKQIYSKEFQKMLDNLDTEEEEEEVGFGGVGGGEKKRRLSVDQVKALERSFEKENKLEPERKNRLAEDLGLQPRQVAIWFQNRRARWKTKQLERDYGVLKSDYDSLRADYDSLEEENNSRLSQLRELKMKLQQRVRAAENNLECECLVVAEEECCPVSELAIVKPQFSYGSNSDDSLVKELEEEDDLNILKEVADAVMPMCSPTSVSSLNHNNTSTTSSGSSCTTAVFSWFQGWDSRAGKAAYPHPQQGMMTRAIAEEQQQLGRLNFFSVDQAPTLHCYFAMDDD